MLETDFATGQGNRILCIRGCFITESISIEYSSEYHNFTDIILTHINYNNKVKCLSGVLSKSRIITDCFI